MQVQTLKDKDPQGRCPACPFLVAGGLGAVGGVGVQAFNDFYSGDFGSRSWQENANIYSVAAGQGAVVGFGTAVAAAAAPFAGLTGAAGTVAVGLSAGGLNARATLIGDSVLGQSTNVTDLAVNSAVSGLTAGTLKSLPKVSGRLPNFGTKAFFAGSHTRRQGAEELMSSGAMTFTPHISQSIMQGMPPRGSPVSSQIQRLQSQIAALTKLVSDLGASRAKKQ